jgi:hypothetical protein
LIYSKKQKFPLLWQVINKVTWYHSKEKTANHELCERKILLGLNYLLKAKDAQGVRFLGI